MNSFKLFKMLKSKHEMKFNEKQKEAYDLMCNGKNVFITGAGGVGKSELIKTFVKIFSDVKKIGLTSTTGTSAIIIGGNTLHSFLGIGLGTDNIDAIYRKISSNKYKRTAWKTLDILIIDEISMLSPELFDKLEALAKRIRMSTEPFGGIQLILSGDLLQLPCVNNQNFCIDSKSWKQCIQHTIYLKEIMRQKDKFFQTCLNNIRLGIVNDDVENLLKSRSNIDYKNNSNIKPTKIYSLNKDVDKINNKALKKLNSENDLQFMQYDMDIENLTKNQYIVNKTEKTHICNKELLLCVGAQVMLVYNLDLDEKLVNGSIGIVVGFESDLPIVKFLNGIQRTIDFQTWDIQENKKVICKVTQIPLKLAFAVSIHKVQGASIDYAEINLKNIFEYSQVYVALSRVRSIEGLFIKGYKNSDCIQSHPKALEFYQNLEKNANVSVTKTDNLVESPPLPQLLPYIDRGFNN